MLDLAQALGEVEGLPLYRDHEDPALVYALPGDIDLRWIAPDVPDLSLQIFYPDEAVVGALDDLGASVGSILSLGVRCLLPADRAARVRAAVAAQLGRDDVRLAVPPWEDGSVQLLLLDAQREAGADPPADGDDALVQRVVGSRRPSLSDGELAALFHARLDRRGTALVSAALQGQAGSMAGVLYELSYAALRPAVDLRMSADLNRCADFIRAGLGVQAYYVGADLSTTFGRMKEEGVIDVQLVSQAVDAEAQRRVDDAVRDFYDVLMRELFRPALTPAEVLGAAGTSVPSTSVVRFSLAYTHTEQSRVVEVDYRQRSATRRRHNPQSHLRALAGLAGGRSSVVQRVPLSAAWREAEVEIAAPQAFDDPRLLSLRVVLWRGQDGVLSPDAAVDGGLCMPAAAVPLVDLAFTRDDAAARRLAYVMQPDEPPYYHWQARLSYADDPDLQSPPEMWSRPQRSSACDLDLFADLLAPTRRVVLQLGSGLLGPPVGIDADVTVRRADGALVAERRLTVDPARPQSRWGVRDVDGAAMRLEAALNYRYADGATLRRPPRVLRDRELPIDDPFTRQVTLVPLPTHPPHDLEAVVFVARYEHAASGFRREQWRTLGPPDFRAEDVVMPVVEADDELSWEASAVRAGQPAFELGRGRSRGGVVPLAFGSLRRFRFEWLGPSPAALQLRVLRVFVRRRDDDGTVLEAPAPLEWRGESVDGERSVSLASEGRAEWAVERRWEDGRRALGPYVALRSDLTPVTGEGDGG